MHTERKACHTPIPHGNEKDTRDWLLFWKGKAREEIVISGLGLARSPFCAKTNKAKTSEQAVRLRALPPVSKKHEDMLKRKGLADLLVCKGPPVLLCDGRERGLRPHSDSQCRKGSWSCWNVSRGRTVFCAVTQLFSSLTFYQIVCHPWRTRNETHVEKRLKRDGAELENRGQKVLRGRKEDI